jgi:two-component system, sensor histidine kinase
LVGCRRRGNLVRIEVWDTGRGIPAEQQQQIFWEFVQVKESGKSASGLGLGLAIVDRLAKLLGHRVEVRSQFGRGSTFSIDVEADSQRSVVSGASIAIPAPGSILDRKLIAIIDDDASVADAVSRLLRSYGAATVTAAHDDELLRLLGGRRPDAVIADGHLGAGRDGFSALNRLEKELGGSLPSLVLTGDDDFDVKRRADAEGRRLLHKPVWPDGLEAALCFELSRSR